MNTSGSSNGFSPVSIEYFPPKGLSAERGLMTGAHALRRFLPRFQTITYGAGGSGNIGSVQWAARLQQLNDIPTASHIALCYFDRAALYALCEELVDSEINRIVLIRGDGVDAPQSDLAGYETVAHAVTDLKKRFGFDISVSAYPEPHPRAASAMADIDVLKAKQDAGADRAITQYFFTNGLYYDFLDSAAARGVTLDIVPGVMPIANFSTIKRFSQNCGATVPSAFDDRFGAAGDDRAGQSDVARAIIEEQVRDLARNDVAAIHIYALNRIDLTADTIRAFLDELPEREEETFRPALAG